MKPARFFVLLAVIVILMAGCAVPQRPPLEPESSSVPDEAPGTRLVFEVQGGEEGDGVRKGTADGTDADLVAAMDRLKRSVSLEPGRWDVHYDLGLLYMRLDALEMAMAEFRKALELKGPPSKVYNALGTISSSMGRKSEAVEFFRSALTLKRSPAVLMNLANTYVSQGLTDKALGYYKEIESMDPSNPLLHYNIGILLYRSGEYEEALEHFDTAVAYGRKDVRTLSARAQVLLKLRRYEDALDAFEELKLMAPKDPLPYRNAGVIYEMYLGDMQKALDNYNAYIDMKGNDAGDVKVWVEVVKARLASGGGR